MKILLLFAAVLMVYSTGFSQNVGIGSTNPAFKLDVSNGSINTDSVYRIGAITVLAAPGIGNLFVGKNAGRNNTGILNTFSGESAGYSNSTGETNSFFGFSTGYYNTSGSNNSFFGWAAGFSNTSGPDNSFFGCSAGIANTTGVENSFFGRAAGNNNTVGNFNSFFGRNSGFNNTSGSSNSFFGESAGFFNSTGSSNTATGEDALYYNTIGTFNTAEGYNSLYNNIDGWYNTANGGFALFNNITGRYNTANGSLSLYSNTTGTKNTADGYSSLFNNYNGTLNTGLGFNSDVFTSALTNATAIGANARVDCSNCLVLGSVNGVQGSISSVNVGIGVNSPNAKLSISTNGNELAGSATGNVLTTNGGTLSNLVNSEMSLANIGFMSTNNSSLGVRAYRTSQGSDWYSTSLLLEYDVDNTARAGGGFLAIGANGNIGISTVLPQARLDVNGTTKTNSLIVTNGGNASDFLIKNDNSGQVGFRKGHVGLGLNYIIAVEGAYPSQFPPQSQGPMIGEIKIFSGNNTPYGWLVCHGQLLLVTDYQDLFNIIGTTYGGNGQNNFALPDLRGAIPVGEGSTWLLGEVSN